MPGRPSSWVPGLALLAACVAVVAFWLAGGRLQTADAGLMLKAVAAEASPHHEEAGMAEEKAVLAGGCFWCTEAVFTELEGVSAVRSGYTGGRRENPTYEQVCSGATGHAEAVEVTFDPARISYRDLLRVFFTTHDPTTLNRQGADEGTQYRSAIFPQSPEQARVAREVIQEVTQEHLYDAPIVTAIEPAAPFYPAEGYHQDYFARNPQQPYCAVVISPKVSKFRAKFKDKLKAAH